MRDIAANSCLGTKRRRRRSGISSPMAVLHLLALAAATTGNGAGLMLPGGVRAVPAVRDS